jgi:hypothetical protein
MKYLARRPMVLMAVTALALTAARFGHHFGRGFHQW